MLAKSYTATIIGLEAVKIEVEVDATRGMPRLIFIGLPTKAVNESKERITSALRNCGIRIRSQRTIVNLAPADLKKSSAVFELAIAVALLKMYGHFDRDLQNIMFFGELSLNGTLKPLTGALPLVLAAKKLGFTEVVLPAANAAEVSLVTGIKIYPLISLKQLLNLIRKEKLLPTLKAKATKKNQSSQTYNQPGLDQVQGQEYAKRALSIALAGGHNLLMSGPPGSGKSMLAKASLSIAPDLTKQELIEIISIHSLYGETTEPKNQRPFRAPHHSITQIGLIGGGSQLKPGEITLAHHGILFLDELTEFKRRSLEALRQPLENKKITLIRAQGKVVYPANFTLIAATNPCPCGYRGSTKNECRCSAYDLERYHKRLSGPILDRFDLILNIKPVNLSKLKNINQKSSVPTHKLKEKINTARQLQDELLNSSGCLCSADLNVEKLKLTVKLPSEAQKLLTKASEKLNLTARGYFKTIKLALTIATLEEKTQPQIRHIAEALQYRNQF